MDIFSFLTSVIWAALRIILWNDQYKTIAVTFTRLQARWWQPFFKFRLDILPSFEELNAANETTKNPMN